MKLPENIANKVNEMNRAVEYAISLNLQVERMLQDFCEENGVECDYLNEYAKDYLDTGITNLGDWAYMFDVEDIEQLISNQ